MDTCPICLEEGIDNMIITNCNHKYCETCIEELLNNNKVECPLCRTIIKEYSNETEKVKIIIKTLNQRSENQNNSDIILIARNEIRRTQMKKYFYMLLFLYTFFSYVNSVYSVINLKDILDNCEKENTNLTNYMDELLKGGVEISMIDYSHSLMSKTCMIPRYFYDRCFSLKEYLVA